MPDSLSPSELDDRIAILRDNIRQLVEQAAAASGAQNEERIADRIAQQEAALDKLVAQRDAMTKKESQLRFFSRTFHTFAATAGPPSRAMARMPVGDVTLISVRWPSMTSMPTNNRPRSHKCGPSRAQISRSRGVRSVAAAAPPRTMLERRSSAAGTRLTAPANSPSTRMMLLSPFLTSGRKR